MSDKNPMGPMFEMFQKFGENLKVPTPDVEKIVDYHRKNIQAVQDSVQAASEGTQSIMAKQREQLEENLAEITNMVQSMNISSDPSKVMSDQMEFAKRSFEKTVKNTTEIGEIARNSSADSFKILQDRMQESIVDIRDSMNNKS